MAKGDIAHTVEHERLETTDEAWWIDLDAGNRGSVAVSVSVPVEETIHVEEDEKDDDGPAQVEEENVQGSDIVETTAPVAEVIETASQASDLGRGQRENVQC